MGEVIVSLQCNVLDKTVTVYLSHAKSPEWGYPVLMLQGLDDVSAFTNRLLDCVQILMGVETRLSPKIVEFINTL